MEDEAQTIPSALPENLPPMPQMQLPTLPQSGTGAAPDLQLPPPAPRPKLSDLIQAQVNKANAPLTTKQSLLQAISQAAPIAIGGLFGGTQGAYGASQGVQQGMAEQAAAGTERRKELQAQLEAEKNREERTAINATTTQERAREADLRKQEIEATNAQRLEGLKGTNQTRLDIQNLKDIVSQQGAAQKNTALDAQMLRAGFGKNETGAYVPTPEKQARDKAEAEYKQAATDHQKAMADLEKARNDPNSPAFRQAQQRLEAASQRLNLSTQQFLMRSRGIDASGEPLPGAMLTSEGTPVGSAFQQNVRPTGQERNKADMASSAREQLGDIVGIVQRHPEIFGPGHGQVTEVENWLGSQSPDAQAFKAARTIAGDHLAGTFGGRSEPALAALDSAIGKFKDNPEAMLAGIKQIDKAAKVFEDKGTVHIADRKNKTPLVKKLDEATAAKYLQQSGGNKDKARAAAKADGYSF